MTPPAGENLGVFDVLFVGTAILCVAVAGYRLRDIIRGNASPAARAVTVTVAGCGIVMLLQASPVIRALDQVTGIANSSQALGHLIGLACGVSAQATLIHVVIASPRYARRRVRQRAVVITVVIAILVAIFLLSPQPPLLDRRIQPHAAGVVYSLLFTGALGLVCADVTRLAGWGARTSARSYLRLGLRLIAVAGMLTVGYAVVKNLVLVARLAGYTEPAAVEKIGVAALIVAATLLYVTGASLPAWGPKLRLDQPVQWLMNYQDHRSLYLLWRDLYQLEPRIALRPPRHPTRWRDILTVTDLRTHLYRRVIEIRDGMLLLRPWFDRHIEDTAKHSAARAGLSGAELIVTVEAAVIAAALAARAKGAAATEGPGPQLTTHDNVATETAWLRQVAAAYHGSPVVRMIAAATSTPPGTTT